MRKMTFLADLHIHSHFSRATSGDCRPELLASTAARKGLALIGTGDFTHAGWREELTVALRESEEGLYRLRDLKQAGAEVRFMVTGEISCIYKQDGRTRKIHHLILLPSLASAAKFSAALEARGANLRADGRPIIGLDSRTLFGLLLEAEPRAILIPAHIWTPHFSLFGSNSGFDALEECFGDLAPQIKAYETGLSSDPPMNWRLSALDRLTLLSNSDAHSPERLGREANEFTAEMSYGGVAAALNNEQGRLAGTIEFFPEEGKYHYDGHRQCGICWHPRETMAAKGICPVCGRPVTVGVLHRVEQLADRREGIRPHGAGDFCSLVSLAQIVSDALETGPASQRAQAVCRKLLEAMGPEIPLLRAGDVEAIAALAGPLVAEGVRKVRAGEIEYRPGFDGEYGKLGILRPEERRRLAGQAALFAMAHADLKADRARHEQAAMEAWRQPAERVPEAPADVWTLAEPLAGLQEAQLKAATAKTGPVVVSAGPGTGKTRTLIQRIACLLKEGVRPETITAITFTHRAADEIKRRLFAAAGTEARGVWVGTFHRFCLDLLTEVNGQAPLLLDEREAAAVMAEIVPRKAEAREKAAAVSLLKAQGIRPGEPSVPPALADVYGRYQERLAVLGAYDYDDLLLAAGDLLAKDDRISEAARRWATHLLVDEFQDVNAAQYGLIKALAGDGRNLFVIGDPDQAIYGFRGADRHFITVLEHDFPHACAHRLELNFRSTGRIVQAANAFSAEARLLAARPGGSRLNRIAAAGAGAEARAVIKEIERLVGGTAMLAADRQSGAPAAGAFSLGEIAVLFRTGRQAEPVEEALLAAGIPYRVLGQRALTAAPEVRESLDILRYLAHPNGLRFLIALGETRFDPGPEALALLGEQASGRDHETFLKAVAELLRKGSFTIGAHERIQGFLDFLAELSISAKSMSAAELLLRAAPPAEEPSRALIQVARALGERPLGEFLLRLTTGQEADHERREDFSRPGEGVSLLTMHAAKGLEFPAVILIGLAEGLVPWRGAESEEELAEEERLFYVALTRAGESLSLIGPPAGGKTAPSRFLSALPEDLLEHTAARPRKPKAEQKRLF